MKVHYLEDDYYVNELEKEIEELKAEIKELNDDIVWWTNRFNAVERNNERLNNIINGTDEILKEHINECREELNTIMKDNDLDYINECSREFDVIRKNIEMIMEKLRELKGE